ncbi:MAG: YciI family protein [Bacteroidia bacterium]
MVQKNEYMLLFRYEPSNDYQPTETELTEMHQQWGAFIGNIAIQEKLVSTHQLGFEGKQIFANQSINEGIYVSDKQTLGGNMIVKAITIDEAVGMAKNCPILLMGGSVEVRAIQSM